LKYLEAILCGHSDRLIESPVLKAVHTAFHGHYAGVNEVARAKVSPPGRGD
jgi:hypothetical protein